MVKQIGFCIALVLPANEAGPPEVWRTRILTLMEQAFAADRFADPDDFRAIRRAEGNPLSLRAQQHGDPGKLKIHLVQNVAFWPIPTATVFSISSAGPRSRPY